MDNIDWVTVIAWPLSIIFAIAFPIIMKRYIDETESERFKAKMRSRSTKISTIIGWTIIALAFFTFTYLVLRYG